MAENKKPSDKLTKFGGRSDKISFSDASIRNEMARKVKTTHTKFKDTAMKKLYQDHLDEKGPKGTG